MNALARILIACVLCTTAPCMGTQGTGRVAEKAAIPTADHPFAGFWKHTGCTDGFGLAIAPAGAKLYSVSFCGPGGCFDPGTYRPNTTIIGDPNYKVRDTNNIEAKRSNGVFEKFVRCPSR